MNAESSFYLVTCLMLIGFLTQADAVTRLKRHETKPTLSFMPKPRIRSLIWVKTDHQSIKYWKDILKEYLAVYKHPSNNSVSCNLFERPPPGKVCNVDVSSMSNPCTESYGFGYKQATPCVFLELSKAQDPRKRVPKEIIIKNDGIHYYPEDNDIKRSPQDEIGPFWANRGKKDPKYIQDPLFAVEPYWLLVRRDEQHITDDPFLGSRGKKETASYNFKLRYRQEFSNDLNSPFYAVRGKKSCRNRYRCEEQLAY